MKKIPKKAFYIVFIVLLVIVLILGIKIILLENKSKDNEKVDMIVPLLNNKKDIKFNISADKFKGKKIYYIFKVTNYRNKNINKKDINYNIKFISDKDTKLKLYRDNIKKLTNNEIKNINLKANKKEEQIYKLEINIPKNKKYMSIDVVIKK